MDVRDWWDIEKREGRLMAVPETAERRSLYAVHIVF